MSDTGTQGTMPQPVATNNGFIQGVQPSPTPDQIRATNAAIFGAGEVSGQGQQVAPGQQQQQPRVFTEAEVEEFRRQEREKLHSRIEKVDAVEARANQMAEQLDQLNAEREERERQAAEAAAAAAAEAEAERTAKLTLTQQFQEFRQQTQAQLDEMRGREEAAQALLAMEQRYQQLQSYKTSRLSDPEVADKIAPQFIEFVEGENEQQIDQKIARAIEASAALLAEFQQAQQQQALAAQQQWAAMPGVSVAGTPGTGLNPIENGAFQTVTKQTVDNMSMAEFARQRQALHAAASAQMRRG